MTELSTDSYFSIGVATRRSHGSAKIARHYELVRLLPKIHCTDSGYRRYTDRDVHTLRFIRRSRSLGFSMLEIGEPLKLWQNQRRSSQDVRNIAKKNAQDFDKRINEMLTMKRTLRYLIDSCSGNDRPDCPSLDELGNAKTEARSPPTHVEVVH